MHNAVRMLLISWRRWGLISKREHAHILWCAANENEAVFDEPAELLAAEVAFYVPVSNESSLASRLLQHVINIALCILILWHSLI